jgi:hypothetical protein
MLLQQPVSAYLSPAPGRSRDCRRPSLCSLEAHRSLLARTSQLRETSRETPRHAAARGRFTAAASYMILIRSYDFHYDIGPEPCSANLLCQPALPTCSAIPLYVLPFVLPRALPCAQLQALGHSHSSPAPSRHRPASRSLHLPAPSPTRLGSAPCTNNERASRGQEETRSTARGQWARE